MSREDFEADIDAYTERLNSRMKEKYRANGHKPPMSELTDLELQHELEGEFDETMVEVTWAALGRYNLIFKKPTDDLEDESADMNNYLCEIWRRADALEALRGQQRINLAAQSQVVEAARALYLASIKSPEQWSALGCALDSLDTLERESL